jgi:hypothetical protein
MTRLRNLGLALACAAGLAVPAHTGTDCNFPTVTCLFSDGIGCTMGCGVRCCNGTAAGCSGGFGVDATCSCWNCPQIP